MNQPSSAYDRMKSHRNLHVEKLEQRLLLAGDTYLINFQLDSAPVPSGYLADVGEVFGNRGNGLSYGWSNDHTDVSRDRQTNADQRLDTLIHFHQGQTWELAVPNGLYEVTVAIGDPDFSSTHTLNVEGTSFWDAVALTPNSFLVETLTVSVGDGRLTLDQGASIEKATRIDYLQVVNLPSGPNAAPATPTVTEPSFDGQIVSPVDVPMEAAGFSDSDGDQHFSSDREIWTTGGSAQRVWQALGLTGARRLDAQLSDGIFENSHAGRSALFGETDYELRVRFRDDVGSVSGYATRVFHTKAAELPVPFISLQPGFEIDTIAGDFQLPVNIAFVPNPTSVPGDPLFYVTELYGTIKVVTNDFSVSDFATNLLNFNPTGNFPGSGEQGLAGIVVDPATGDVFVTRVSDTDGLPGGDHHPQVVRFTSNDGGLTAATETVLLDMPGETQGQSHQISNVTIGPDGKVYVHNGDGFDSSTAQNLDSYRGKILRMNLDGTAPTDNVFYDAVDGINARDYIFAYGVRNPFGGAWRAADGKHYEVENGPSIDRLAQINEGVNYGWTGSNSDMLINAIYNWDPAHAPVNITFVEPETFGGSQFPGSKMDRAFVSESGPTYFAGPQTRGKRIVEFELDENGNLLGGPTTLIEYVGTGRGTVVGLATGPDGLYFTELYKDLDAVTPIDAGARVFRVRYTAGGDADFDVDGDVDGADFLDWQRGFGAPGANRADGDADNDDDVDSDDLGIWAGEFGASSSFLSAASGSAPVDTEVSPRALSPSHDGLTNRDEIVDLAIVLATQSETRFNESDALAVDLQNVLAEGSFAPLERNGAADPAPATSMELPDNTGADEEPDQDDAWLGELLHEAVFESLFA